MIVVEGLVRRRGGRAVVDGVSFMVGPGEILGLAGLNGAGKTSLIECLAGLARPDAGLLRVAGQLPGSAAARAATGVLLQQSGLPARLTVAESLGLFAGLHGCAVDRALAATLGLDALARQRVDRLSGGQRQRLALAVALQPGAPVLLLDEPAAALDPPMRRDLAILLAARRDAGAAILLATHDLADAADLCDRVLVLHAGRAVALCPPADLAAAGSLAALVQSLAGTAR